MKRLLAAAALLLSIASSAAAQQTVLIVRHAERADAGGAGGSMMGSDPELSDRGRARAEALAATLKDAGIAAIYVTEFKRTQQTAAPLAKALGLVPSVVNAKDLATLVAKIKATTGNVLVVGHSNTVGEIVRALGIDAAVKIGDNDYDDLFVVSGGTLLRLHYRS